MIPKEQQLAIIGSNYSFQGLFQEAGAAELANASGNTRHWQQPFCQPASTGQS